MPEVTTLASAAGIFSDFAAMWGAAQYDATSDTTFWTYLNEDGDACVQSWDHATETASAATVLHAALDPGDTHAQPALLIRSSDRKVLVVYSAHNGTSLYTRLSSAAADISAFAAEVDIDASVGGAEYTYPQIHEMDDGIYIIVRTTQGDAGQIWSYTKSTDNGATWSAKVDFGQEATTWMYALTSQTATDRVDFLVCEDAPFGVADGVSIFHMYMIAGTFYKTDGTEITAAKPFATSAMTAVWTSDGTQRGDPGQVILGNDGHPRALFREFEAVSPDPEDGRYMWSRWTGSAWTTAVEIAAAGSGAVRATAVFVDGDPFTVYYTKDDGSGISQIFRAKSYDNGVTWASAQVTDSADEQSRIVTVRNGPVELQVMWLGDYVDDETNADFLAAGSPAAAGVYADWDRDGFDVGDNDDLPVRSWTISRGAGAEITGGAQPGSCTLLLKNPSDIHNPYNASGALFGKLRDGVPVWVGPNSTGVLTGTDPRGLFGGRITDISLIPAAGVSDAPSVEIVCEDAIGWYRRLPVRVDYEEGRSQEQLRREALAAAGETRFDLAHEIHTMPLSNADGDLLSVLDAINSANGTRHLAKPADHYLDWYDYLTRNRFWRTSAESDGTLNAGSDHVTGTSGWRQSADTVTNRQKATVQPIVFTPATFTVWEAETLPVELTEDKSYTVFVDFDDVVRDAVLDIASTGDAVTSTLTPFATSAKIELSVGAGDTATVTALSIEGRLARRPPTESHEANDTTSQAAPRGIRAGSDISGEYVGVMASAVGIAEHVVWRYGSPQLRPTLTVENWLPEQFELDLYDVIAFTSTQLGMSGRLFEIVGLTHEGNHAAVGVIHHVTTYVLQECRAQADPGWFVLDDSLLDGDDVLHY